MATLTVRNLDDDLKQKLRVQAARHGRSMEEEIRTILRTALMKESRTGPGLADRVRQRFQPLGGADLVIEERQALRESPLAGDAG